MESQRSDGIKIFTPGKPESSNDNGQDCPDSSKSPKKPIILGVVQSSTGGKVSTGNTPRKRRWDQPPEEEEKGQAKKEKQSIGVVNPVNDKSFEEKNVGKGSVQNLINKFEEIEKHSKRKESVDNVLGNKEESTVLSVCSVSSENSVKSTQRVKLVRPKFNVVKQTEDKSNDNVPKIITDKNIVKLENVQTQSSDTTSTKSLGKTHVEPEMLHVAGTPQLKSTALMMISSYDDSPSEDSLPETEIESGQVSETAFDNLRNESSEVETNINAGDEIQSKDDIAWEKLEERSGKEEESVLLEEPKYILKQGDQSIEEEMEKMFEEVEVSVENKPSPEKEISNTEEMGIDVPSSKSLAVKVGSISNDSQTEVVKEFADNVKIEEKSASNIKAVEETVSSDKIVEVPPLNLNESISNFTVVKKSASDTEIAEEPLNPKIVEQPVSSSEIKESAVNVTLVEQSASDTKIIENSNTEGGESASLVTIFDESNSNIKVVEEPASNLNREEETALSVVNESDSILKIEEPISSNSKIEESSSDVKILEDNTSNPEIIESNVSNPGKVEDSASNSDTVEEPISNPIVVEPASDSEIVEECVSYNKSVEKSASNVEVLIENNSDVTVIEQSVLNVNISPETVSSKSEKYIEDIACTEGTKLTVSENTKFDNSSKTEQRKKDSVRHLEEITSFDHFKINLSPEKNIDKSIIIDKTVTEVKDNLDLKLQPEIDKTEVCTDANILILDNESVGVEEKTNNEMVLSECDNNVDIGVMSSTEKEEVNNDDTENELKIDTNVNIDKEIVQSSLEKIDCEDKQISDKTGVNLNEFKHANNLDPENNIVNVHSALEVSDDNEKTAVDSVTIEPQENVELNCNFKTQLSQTNDNRAVMKEGEMSTTESEMLEKTLTDNDILNTINTSEPNEDNKHNTEEANVYNETSLVSKDVDVEQYEQGTQQDLKEFEDASSEVLDVEEKTNIKDSEMDKNMPQTDIGTFGLESLDNNTESIKDKVQECSADELQIENCKEIEQAVVDDSVVESSTGKSQLAEEIVGAIETSEFSVDEKIEKNVLEPHDAKVDSSEPEQVIDNDSVSFGSEVVNSKDIMNRTEVTSDVSIQFADEEINKEVTESYNNDETISNIIRDVADPNGEDKSKSNEVCDKEKDISVDIMTEGIDNSKDIVVRQSTFPIDNVIPNSDEYIGVDDQVQCEVQADEAVVSVRVLENKSISNTEKLVSEQYKDEISKSESDGELNFDCIKKNNLEFNKSKIEENKTEGSKLQEKTCNVSDGSVKINELTCNPEEDNAEIKESFLKNIDDSNKELEKTEGMFELQNKKEGNLVESKENTNTESIVSVIEEFITTSGDDKKDDGDSIKTFVQHNESEQNDCSKNVTELEKDLVDTERVQLESKPDSETILELKKIETGETNALKDTRTVLSELDKNKEEETRIKEFTTDVNEENFAKFSELDSMDESATESNNSVLRIEITQPKEIIPVVEEESADVKEKESEFKEEFTVIDENLSKVRSDLAKNLEERILSKKSAEKLQETSPLSPCIKSTQLNIKKAHEKEDIESEHEDLIVTNNDSVSDELKSRSSVNTISQLEEDQLLDDSTSNLLTTNLTESLNEINTQDKLKLTGIDSQVSALDSEDEDKLLNISILEKSNSLNSLLEEELLEEKKDASATPIFLNEESETKDSNALNKKPDVIQKDVVDDVNEIVEKERMETLIIPDQFDSIACSTVESNSSKVETLDTKVKNIMDQKELKSEVKQDKVEDKDNVFDKNSEKKESEVSEIKTVEKEVDEKNKRQESLELNINEKQLSNEELLVDVDTSSTRKEDIIVKDCNLTIKEKEKTKEIESIEGEVVQGIKESEIISENMSSDLETADISEKGNVDILEKESECPEIMFERNSETINDNINKVNKCDEGFAESHLPETDGGIHEASTDSKREEIKTTEKNTETQVIDREPITESLDTGKEEEVIPVKSKVNENEILEATSVSLKNTDKVNKSEWSQVSKTVKEPIGNIIDKTALKRPFQSFDKSTASINTDVCKPSELNESESSLSKCAKYDENKSTSREVDVNISVDSRLSTENIESSNSDSKKQTQGNLPLKTKIILKRPEDHKKIETKSIQSARDILKSEKYKGITIKPIVISTEQPGSLSIKTDTKSPKHSPKSVASPKQIEKELPQTKLEPITLKLSKDNPVIMRSQSLSPKKSSDCLKTQDSKAQSVSPQSKSLGYTLKIGKDSTQIIPKETSGVPAGMKSSEFAKVEHLFKNTGLTITPVVPQELESQKLNKITLKLSKAGGHPEIKCEDMCDTWKTVKLPAVDIMPVGRPSISLTQSGKRKDISESHTSEKKIKLSESLTDYDAGPSSKLQGLLTKVVPSKITAASTSSAMHMINVLSHSTAPQAQDNQGVIKQEKPDLGVPRKRGRPRKVIPSVVPGTESNQFGTGEMSSGSNMGGGMFPVPLFNLSDPFTESDPQNLFPGQVQPSTGRPQRSCRGRIKLPIVRTRRPRGGGILRGVTRGRGRGRGMKQMLVDMMLMGKARNTSSIENRVQQETNIQRELGSSLQDSTGLKSIENFESLNPNKVLGTDSSTSDNITSTDSSFSDKIQNTEDVKIMDIKTEPGIVKSDLDLKYIRNTKKGRQIRIGGRVKRLTVKEKKERREAKRLAQRARAARLAALAKQPPPPQMFEEETRMSATESNSRAQTPARTASGENPDESMGSMGDQTNTSTNRNKKGRMEVIDLESGKELTVDQVAEYQWPLQGGELYMIQEQISNYLGVKSFKRKYPDLKRRQVEPEERTFLCDTGLVTESMCDLGLTAVSSAEVLDIMYQDFQEKYEDFRKHMREKQAKEMTNKQKAEKKKAEQGQSKMDSKEQAMQSAVSWNQALNKARQEQRRCALDLQTWTIQFPKSRRMNMTKPMPKVGNYPLALIPGQYADYYRGYTPQELRYFPINTVLYGPMRPNERQVIISEGSDGSQSESEDSSSSDDSSDSSSDGEGTEEEEKEVPVCKVCGHDRSKIATPCVHFSSAVSNNTSAVWG